MFELDDDTRQDILDSFNELSQEVESTLAQLNEVDNLEQLNQIFRAIHTIKGHAAMFQLEPLVNFTHALEEIAESLRSQRYAASDLISQCIQLGMDRLKDLHQRELCQQSFPNLNECAIQEQFLIIASATPDNVNDKAQALLQQLSGGIEYDTAPIVNETTQAPPIHNPLTEPSNQQTYADLAFFQEISFQVDSQNPYWVDRSIQLFDWAQKLNLLANTPVDYQQLAAATYMHDIGMSFIPSSIITKAEKLTAQEFGEIHRHPVWGYEFICRMPGWSEAATMVLQHHERMDGKGYPSGLSQDEIHPGAKILAILDAFFSMIHGRADREQRRTTIRAISEINAAAGSQFDQHWVALFNDMIKHEVKDGLI